MVVLIGLLVSVESATKGSIDDDVSKADTAGSFNSFKELKVLSTPPLSKRASAELTEKNLSSIPARSPDTADTPTISNTKTPVKSSLKKKGGSSSSLGEMPTNQRKDLEPILKNNNEEPVLKNNVDEDDVPSIVTWDVANEITETTDPDILQKRNAHRREQSLIEGDLIDSNLEPHYSNLIDSANAPIFGVDSEGRVNVWNKCAVRIVGYTPDEVMGKVSVNQSSILSCLIHHLPIANRIVLYFCYRTLWMSSSLGITRLV